MSNEVDYAAIAEYAATSGDTPDWRISIDYNKSHIPFRTLSILTKSDPISITEYLDDKTNSLGQTCTMWFQIWEEDIDCPDFVFMYPMNIREGEPIMIIMYTCRTKIEVPWVHGKDGLTLEVLLPVIVSESMERIYEIHRHVLHPTWGHCSSDKCKKNTSKYHYRTIRHVYKELSKCLPQQLICEYSGCSISDCYRQL